MKFAILAVIAAGCGGRASPPAAPPSALPPFAAARWIPARPIYVLASPSLAGAQGAARDAIDLLAVATGHDLREAIRTSSALFGVDALHAEPLAAIGVDVRGSWAMFGSDASPTLVVRLANPAQMTAFLEHQRARGLVTRSTIVDGVDLVSATLPVGLTVSWAIDGGWMWIHVALPGIRDDAGGWFTASHGAHDAAWTGNWAWAQRAAGAAASVVGVFDLHGAIAGALARLPDAVACARIAEPVGRVALAVEGDAHHVAARVALDAGSTERLRAMLLPAPGGWGAAAAGAAIAVQWNVDLAIARPWLLPCLAAAGVAMAQLDQTGVRSARAMLVGFDPDTLSGTGAIALDVSTTGFLERQLDRIPLRRTLESDRSFGPYRGHEISIPFSVTIDYVLEPRLAITALGDGLLERIVGPPPRRAATTPATTMPGTGGAPAPPIFALDVAPPAMSADAWRTLIDGVAERRRDGSSSELTRRAVDQLLTWRDGHLAVTADGGEIVITASGNRR